MVDFLTLKNICKTFKSATNEKVKAVDQFNLNIKKGELLTLLGPSGCGKTTILRMIAGFEQQDSGDILLEGKTISHIPANARNIPLTFQTYALFPHLTLFENIAFGLKSHDVSPKLIPNDVEMILHLVNLVGLENRYPRELSGGQQQRASLARALVLKPPIILLDEPLSNLEMKLRVQTREEIRQIQKTLGITAVYVTHDQEEAISIADRIVVMKDGKIMQVDTPMGIYNAPQSTFVADFIGNTNFMEASIISNNEDNVQLTLVGQELTIPRTQVSEAIAEGEEVYLTIKPEAIQRCDQSSFSGEVIKSQFLGSAFQYDIEFGNSFITLLEQNQSPNQIQAAEGETVYLKFPIECMKVIKQS